MRRDTHSAEVRLLGVGLRLGFELGGGLGAGAAGREGHLGLGRHLRLGGVGRGGLPFRLGLQLGVRVGGFGLGGGLGARARVGDGHLEGAYRVEVAGV